MNWEKWFLQSFEQSAKWKFSFCINVQQYEKIEKANDISSSLNEYVCK